MIDVSILKGSEATIEFGKDEKYTIKYITDTQLKQLAAKHGINTSEIIPMLLGAANQDNQLFDTMTALIETDFYSEVVSMAVISWEGITENGKDFECNEKNKKLVFDSFANRTLFIYNKCRKTDTFSNVNLGDDLKNLKPSSITN